MELIANIAGLLSLLGFLPQTIKTIRSRQTKDLSLPTFLFISSSALLWVIYGLQVHTVAIWFTNAVVLICTFIIALMKIRNG
jgi:MtN3 and saliva related transmembrane protein